MPYQKYSTVRICVVFSIGRFIDIAFSLSINSFSSEGAFKFINDDVITEVECFVRDELLDLLKQSRNIDHNVMSCFYGKFAAKPNQFQFSHDEKCLILSLVQYNNEPHGVNDLSTVLADLDLQEKRKPNKSSSRWYFENNNCENSDIHFDDVDHFDQTNEIESQNESQNETQTHYVLNRLLETANQNKLRHKAGYRFYPDVKQWAVGLRNIAGPTAYTMLQKNLDLALPSLSTVNYLMHNKGPAMIEGVPRLKELRIYLLERNMPLTICLSEDATNIENRVQYDSKKNILVGFVPPLDQNGMPIPLMFKARHAEEIVQHFCNNIPTSTSIITVMAQPIGNAPPFCLLAFGTDTKFVGEDVAKRWNYLINELNKIGINVLTFSSDSDSKYNRAMRKNAQLGCKSVTFDAGWFKCGGDVVQIPYYVQDTPHLVGKLRNLLVKTLRYPEMLQFGNYFIQLNHLQFLLNHVPKDQHQLTQTILRPEDKQNFASVLRICDQRVRQLLLDHVEGSAGTVKFLEIIQNFHDSYMDTTLSSLDRVSKLWYSTFLARIWRQYVLKKPNRTLRDNFITWNTFSCMEHNAHAMVLIILFLNTSNQPNLFKPWLYSSQPCEGFYRILRSFTPCFSQVTNCTVKEMLYRIHRIGLQNDISNDSSNKFIFPNKLKAKYQERTNDSTLPNKSEILQEILAAKTKAIDDAITLGLMNENERSKIDLDSHIEPYSRKTTRSRQKESFEDEMGHYSSDQSSEAIFGQLEHTSLKNFAYKFGEEPIDEKSQYTDIFGGDKRIVIKKMSLCWFLRKGGPKLSSDRLLRVQNKTSKMKCKKRKCAPVKHFPRRFIQPKFNQRKKGNNNK